MQVIHIMPASANFLINSQPMQMMLTHLVERNTAYKRWCKHVSGYKILDNSLIELGGAVNIGRVTKAAQAIEADEIILPDVFLDCWQTVRAVEASIEYLRTNRLLGKYKIMAVCQGKDAGEFRQCFDKLKRMPEVDVIGIPKVCAKFSHGGRPDFEDLWTAPAFDKKVHLLGVWYSWEELYRFKKPNFIRSVDTAMAAYLACNNLPFTGVRPDGFTIDLEKTMLRTKARNNLVLLDRVGA